MVGAMVSITVTENEQLAVAPFAAVTTWVTSVVPKGKVLLLAGPAVRAIAAPAQLSVKAGRG